MSPDERDTPAIEIADLEKAYGDTHALRGLSLEAHPGEIVGLIGPDGAGKTTAMRIVCGLIRPDSGSACIVGLDSTRDARRIKPHVGYMPQRFSLYPDLTVGENLRFFADLFGVRGAEREETEQRLMAFSRLGPFRDRRADQLSGGMKQKLALSCTLVHQPRVLVLDEPTTGVDAVSRREFWTILRDLASEGLALLVSTPYMDEATRCDRVVLLHGGRVLAVERPEGITRHFGKSLVAVRGRDLQVARARLLDDGWSGSDRQVAVHRFGDRLHVVLDASADASRVRERLAGLEVSIDAIEPSIEDTFVELTTGGTP
jgi:ABC-2 type transport system ATP-binding protein